MQRTLVLWILLSAVAGLSARPLWSAPRASPKAATGAEAKWAAAKEERWLAYILDDELRRGSGLEQREELSGRLTKVALAWAGCGRLEQFDTPVNLVHAMRACKYLAVLEAAGDEPSEKLAKWLMEHREVRRVLFRAMDDVPSPKEALTAFRELQANEPDKVLEYPDLAAAFATARGMRFYKSPPEPATTLESFLYYADPKKKFRYNLKKMPYELSRYLADTRISIAERTWAAKRYARTRNLGTAYFHVKYDWPYFKENKPKKISELPYTLQNLAKVGGVCIEQAYYACQVCKSLGVPSAIVSGRGTSGVGHAWFTYFQMDASGTSASWHGGAGRYASQLYFTGSVTDPATGKGILDSELVLVGSAALLPLHRREEAEAAATVAKLVADACVDGNMPADPAPLRQLALDYEKRLAKQPGAPKLDSTWIGAKRKIDRPLVEDLIDVAIKRNLAYTPAWQLIIDLRKADRLPVESLDPFFNVLISKTATAFPELSCHMVLQLVPTLTDETKREKAYRRALAVYGRRPDLKGKILLAMGDESRTLGENKKAVKIYQAAAVQCIQVPDIAFPAAARAEEILVAENQRSAALRMYAMLFGKTPKETDAAAEIRKSTPHYRFGTRLAELLRQAGKAAAADRIISDL